MTYHDKMNMPVTRTLRHHNARFCAIVARWTPCACAAAAAAAAAALPKLALVAPLPCLERGGGNRVLLARSCSSVSLSLLLSTSLAAVEDCGARGTSSSSPSTRKRSEPAGCVISCVNRDMLGHEWEGRWREWVCDEREEPKGERGGS